MKDPIIFHNPRCSKSRQSLALLEEKGIQVKIRHYLDEPPSVEELHDLLEKLSLEASQLIRRKESLYKELGLSKSSTEQELIAAMSQHPKLIERPIVVHGSRARLGRPPEQVLEIFEL